MSLCQPFNAFFHYHWLSLPPRTQCFISREIVLLLFIQLLNVLLLLLWPSVHWKRDVLYFTVAINCENNFKMWALGWLLNDCLCFVIPDIQSISKRLEIRTEVWLLVSIVSKITITKFSKQSDNNIRWGLVKVCKLTGLLKPLAKYNTGWETVYTC